ncbi:MAG: acetyl-CoA carboxylase biotin carboxyl carrier protein [Myxococcota bacterium]
MEIDLDQLRELMKALREFELDEIELEHGDERIVLRKTGAATATAVPIAHMPSVVPPPPAAPIAAAAPAEQEDDDAVYITSPFVGTFYRSPNPNSDAFVTKGASFEAGQTLCIVEAMKLMNEIEAEYSGTIVDILVENGKPVEYGDRLFRVTKS